MKNLVTIIITVVLLLMVAASPVLAGGAVEVEVDIKPGSDPNALNVWSKGMLLVAILGSEDFDVMTIDPETIYLWWEGITLPDGIAVVSGDVLGVMPVRWAWEDVNGDGFTDIGLKFKGEDLMTVTITDEPHRELVAMTVIGYLFDGKPIMGEDTVLIINKKYNGS